MPDLAAHQTEFWIFAVVFALVTVMGFVAGRWRRSNDIHTLEEWGLGGRAFGNWVTFFLLSGDVYTAYTFVAVPTLVYGVGAAGFFPVPFLVIVYPMFFVVLTRFWSVSHVHGFVTPAEFVRARFGSRALGLCIAVAGILATMPYIALQLIGIEAVFKVMGLPGGWPLTVAFVVLALYTFNSGLRAPALLSIVKDSLVLWTVLAAFLIVASHSGGWASVFKVADGAFESTPRANDGLLLPAGSELNYITLAFGSAAALFLYPHTLTGVLAARNRATLRRNMAALPIYTLTLGVLMLIGFAAIFHGTTPIGGDRNTVVPLWFDQNFPDWSAGLAFAAIGVGAMVPAAIMSIAAANLFTRSVYREFIRPHATPAEETAVSKIASLTVKFGAVLVILLLNTQFAIDLQLIGGVFIMQTLPAVALGLYTGWFHRYALIGGLFAGMLAGLVLLYQVPQLGGADGRTVLRPHFGGSAWPLSNIGLDTHSTIYAGVVALAVNLVVTVVATPLLRLFGAPDGRDETRPQDYAADEGDPRVRRMTEIIDGDVAPEAEPGRWPGPVPAAARTSLPMRQPGQGGQAAGFPGWPGGGHNVGQSGGLLGSGAGRPAVGYHGNHVGSHRGGDTYGRTYAGGPTENNSGAHAGTQSATHPGTHSGTHAGTHSATHAPAHSGMHAAPHAGNATSYPDGRQAASGQGHGAGHGQGERQGQGSSPWAPPPTSAEPAGRPRSTLSQRMRRQTDPSTPDNLNR